MRFYYITIIWYNNVRINTHCNWMSNWCINCFNCGYVVGIVCDTPKAIGYFDFIEVIRVAAAQRRKTETRNNRTTEFGTSLVLLLICSVAYMLLLTFSNRREILLTTLFWNNKRKTSTISWLKNVQGCQKCITLNDIHPFPFLFLPYTTTTHSYLPNNNPYHWITSQCTCSDSHVS